MKWHESDYTGELVQAGTSDNVAKTLRGAIDEGITRGGGKVAGMVTKAEVTYADADGTMHSLTADICDHPIVSLNRFWIGEREIPIEQVRLSQEPKLRNRKSA
jgi:hypothetical protein